MMELKISDLRKEFKDIAAVRNVSYTMSTGVYGLLGVNGAGKTTLMRMLCTLIRPTGGSITWNGRDIFEMDGDYRKLLGYLPQEFGYYPDFTVYDYLMYTASIKGLRPVTARQRTKLLLKQVGMEKAADKKMKKLSGGMKRRVGIAQAMLGNPQILILDEPTAGLDPKERIRFRNLISELSENRLVLLSTHIVPDIAYIANEILLMQDGEIRAAGTAQQLIDAMPQRVWSVEAVKEEAASYMKAYKVSNVKAIPGGVSLRVISPEKPAGHAVLETATLEDLFLYYFGEKENDDKDVEV